MSSCKCGAALTKAVTESGTEVSLEGYSEAANGPGYFALDYTTEPVTAVPITAPGITGYPEHGPRCPFR
jgi:phosphoribosylcarboxyaminoimidazole (NCAIR) mutase